jgi:sugar phosphate isomerase/epimerase
VNFAFSTAIEPAWDLPAVTAIAKELGFGGIEVQLPRAAEPDPAAGSPLQDRDLVRLAFEQAGVQLVAIATSLYFTGENRGDLATSDAVNRVIELAARVKCTRVTVLDIAVPPRMPRFDGMMRLADRLTPLAELAGDAGICLLVQNALSFRSAADIWRVIEQASHPALAVAWDPLASALAGDPATLPVQVLNSRIRHVVLRDASLLGSGNDRRLESLRPLGGGALMLAKVLERLRGIGYADWMSLTYPGNSGLGEAREVLRGAAEQFQKWKPVAVAKKAARSASAKPTVSKT